jgi:hypothetical protein
MASGKDRDDEVYEQGVCDGQNADFLDQVSNSLSKGFTLDARLNDIYQKGYQYGVAHRPAPDHRSSSAPATRTREPVRRAREATTNIGDTSSPNDNGCAKVVGGLIAGVIILWLAVWLAANVVLPLALLNSALVLCTLSVVYRQRQVLLAGLALLGGCYMLVDIAHGWLSANFVNNVVKNPQWLTAFVYVNAVAVAVSAWFLISRALSSATVTSSGDRTRVLLQVAAVVLAGTVGGLLPIVYHGSINPSASVVSEPTAPESKPIALYRANGDACGESLDFLDRFPAVDSRRLVLADLANLTHSQLGFLRNYIYARHGRVFAKRTYAKCFSQFSWYHADGAYRDGMLNSVEQANIAALITQERSHKLADNSAFGTFKGAWFEIAVPPNFLATPSMKSSTSATGYDSAVFRSPDRKVEFYICSPQWNREPSDIALDPLTEKQSSYRSDTSRQRTVTWFTIEAKDGSYTRTYQDTRAINGSTRWVVGVKYSDRAAFDTYQDEYAKFKKSLRQFAD